MSASLLMAMSLAAYAAAAPAMMINDQDFVDKINSQPGILWKAGMNSRFENVPLKAFKSLNGVKPDSWGMVQVTLSVRAQLRVRAVVPSPHDGRYYTAP